MASKPKYVFLFDMARHRSHLFFRYLCTHPDVQSFWHPYVPAFLFGPDRFSKHTKSFDADGNEVEWIPPSGDNTYADGNDKYLNAVNEAEQKGKILVANEHCPIVLKQEISTPIMRNQPMDFFGQPNPTVIPDQIYEALTPLFVIRHPIFSVQSNYVAALENTHMRPGDETWKFATAMPLQRLLFDHFRIRKGKPPLVVDGDDIIWRTNDVRDSLSKALNITPEGLSEVWKSVPEENRHEHPVIRFYLQTIDDSTGIQRPSDQPPDVDLDKAYSNWTAQYGPKIANELRSTAEQNIPHYEYMRLYKV